jgi:glycosyltransferase involved in cell wall biosynthesis
LGLPVRALYVSYDGALDPLGASQVVPYIAGLAELGVSTALISFEKEEQWADRRARAELTERLSSRGVRWLPLRYHRRPRVPATLWDVWNGARTASRDARDNPPDVVHCRGDVAAMIARHARLPPSAKLLYDVRGFFADERVESGSWRAGSLLDRRVRSIESANLARADGLVVLTAKAAQAMAQRRNPLPPHRVIPTCVDLEAFRPRPAGQPPDFGLAYCGSLGSWYMAPEMIAFARTAAAMVPGRVLLLTPNVEEARAAGADEPWAELKTAAPHEVPSWVQRARAAFFFYRPTSARRATCPTKMAEALACGLPVVCNRGIGDVDSLLEEERVGVLVEEFSHDAFRTAAQRLAALLQDPDLPARCRRVAAARFDVRIGVRSYHELYRELALAARPDR